MAHFPISWPVEFVNSQIPWSSVRTTAVAVLGTNVTQVLNKNGTILAGRLNPNLVNAWEATTQTVAGLHPAEKAYLPLETGFYTYCPPSTDLAFFADCTLNTSVGAPNAPIFNLDNDALYNKLFLATTVNSQLAITTSWHIEFRTTSSLFQVGLSAMTLESLHAAQLVLAENGFFFENPEHDTLLGKVIRTAKKYAPEVVSSMNPMAGKLLKMVVNQASKRGATVTPKPGPTKPPSTSAKSSGILGQSHTKTKKKKK